MFQGRNGVKHGINPITELAQNRLNTFYRPQIRTSLPERKAISYGKRSPDSDEQRSISAPAVRYLGSSPCLYADQRLALVACISSLSSAQAQKAWYCVKMLPPSLMRGCHPCLLHFRTSHRKGILTLFANLHLSRICGRRACAWAAYGRMHTTLSGESAIPQRDTQDMGGLYFGDSSSENAETKA